MLKGKLAVLCLCAVMLLSVFGIASAGVIDPCATTCAIVATGGAVGPPFPLFTCLAGDTEAYSDQVGGTGSGIGYYLAVVLIDTSALPIENLPPSDWWVNDCDPGADIVLCAGAASTAADSATNAAGETTIGGIGTTSSGGCADGLIVVVQGNVLEDPGTGCTTDLCKDIRFRSPDINGDNTINVVDLGLFSGSFPPQPYDTCCDMNQDTVVNIVDLSKFASHFGPPGHACP